MVKGSVQFCCRRFVRFHLHLFSHRKDRFLSIGVGGFGKGGGGGFAILTHM
jgi:hypothetical protein